MITSNQLTVTLDVSTMGVTFNSGLTTVNANSYLTNQFVVQPTANLLVNQTMWVVFQSTGETVTTQELMLAMRTVTPLTETQDVQGGTVTPTTATQEYYTQIPQAIMQNPGVWSFSLAIREQDDTSTDEFTQIDTSTVYNFTVLNSLIGAGAGGTTPNTVDIANLYKTALGTVNEAKGYAENAQTYAEQAQGYAEELSGAIGEIDGFQQQLDNIVDGTTPVAEALNAQTANTAQSAHEAGKATNDGDGNNIATTYATKTNLALKQNITDPTLNTTAKTIVGAINENATAIAGLQQDFKNEDHFKGFAQTAEDVQAITANLNDFAYCVATGTIWTYEASGWTNSNEPYPSDATPLSDTTPLQDGTATAGKSTSAARGDHVHPTDTSRASATDLAAHVNDLNNPHEVTADQIGAYVKPSDGIPETDLSTAVQQALWTNNSIVLTSDTGTLTSEQLETLTASYGNFIQYGANVYNYNYTDGNNRVYSVQRSINDSDSTTDVIGYFGNVQVDMTSGAYQIYTFTVNSVVANPTLSGSEAELTGLEVAGTKYKVPSGGGIVAVDSLPNANQTEYEKHLLYLQGGELKFIAEKVLEEPTVDVVATLPSGRQSTSAVAIGTNAYIFGGYDGNNLSGIVKFDSISQTVTKLSVNLPSARNSTSAVAIGTNAYIFGGYDGSNGFSDIIKFDSISQTVTTLNATLPKKMSGTFACAIGTNAYVFGGTRSGNKLDDIVKFDSVAQTVTTLSATLKWEMTNSSAVAIGTNAYIFGGNAGSVLYQIFKFDSVAQTVTQLSVGLPSKRQHTSAVAIGTNAYIFGGNDGSGIGRYDDIVKFDSAAQTVTTLSATLPSGRMSTSAVAIGTNAYVFGGSAYINETFTNLSEIVQVAFGTTYVYKKITSSEV